MFYSNIFMIKQKKYQIYFILNTLMPFII